MWKVKQAKYFIIFSIVAIMFAVYDLLIIKHGLGIIGLSLSGLFMLVFPISSFIYVTAKNKNYFISTGIFILALVWFLFLYILYHAITKPFGHIGF